MESEVRALLPHRAPFLFVDRVRERSDSRIVTEWRVPVERLGQLIEQDDEQVHPSLAPPREEPKTVEASEPEQIVAQPAEIIDAVVVRDEAPEDEASDIEQDRAEPARLPDDPGVDPSQDQDKSERRFRLF